MPHDVANLTYWKKIY